MTPQKYALIGLGLSLPLSLLFSAIIFELTPLEVFFKSLLTTDGNQPSIVGLLYMATSLALIPVGFVFALYPMLKKNKSGKRAFYLLNVLVILFLFIVSIPTWGGILKDVYRCDVLRIPNCD